MSALVEKDGKTGECPVCGHIRKIHIMRDRNDGFIICAVCSQCRVGILRDSKELRRRSIVIAYGLALDPNGGRIRLEHNDYHISLVERRQQWGDYPEEEEANQAEPKVSPETEEERRARRQAELDKLCPKVDDTTCWQEEVVEDWRRR